MRAFLRGAWAAAILHLPLAGFAAAADETLVFGVLNQQSPTLTAERWNPILAHVGRSAGVALKLAMGATVELTNEMMARGEFDFVFTNHNFKPDYDGLGLRVVARWGSEPVRAAIAVAGDGPLAQLGDLRGRSVVFPSRFAFLGYAVPSVALRAAGVEVEESFAANQEGALAQLRARRVDAAAVNSRFLAEYVERNGGEFRTIYLSEPFPDLAVLAHPRLPAATVEAVRRALVGMTGDADARAVLAAADCPGFTDAAEDDYAGVRAVYRQAR